MSHASVLKSLLEKILKLYGEFYVIAENKNKDLVSIDFSQMNEFLKSENFIAGQIKRLENQRAKAFEDISKNSEIVSLREFISTMEDKVAASELDSLRLKLIDITDKVKELNGRNLELIQTSLGIINNTLKIITDLSANNNDTYNRNGFDDRSQDSEQSSFSLVDVKI